MTFILILLILFFSLLAIKLLNTEHFQTENENSLEKITKLLKNNDLVNQRKQFFDSVETTNKHLKKFTGKSGPNTNIPQKILDNYLEKYLENSKENVSLNSNENEGELPIIINNNYKHYNHKLHMINNKKKIRQDYIINLLKYKIYYLLDTLEDVNKLNLNKIIEENQLTDEKKKVYGHEQHQHNDT